MKDFGPTGNECIAGHCYSPNLCEQMGCAASHDATKADAEENYKQGIRRGLTIARNYLYRTGHHVAASNLGDYKNDDVRVMADSASIDGEHHV
jgi:hypothetical protein